MKAIKLFKKFQILFI